MIIQNFNQVNPADLVTKWNKWVGNLPTKDAQENMAVLLENENNYIQGRLLKESTTSGDAGVFQKVILPVIKRVYPRLVAPELVGMQPMAGPHGLAVFLRYIYDATAGAVTANDQILEPASAAYPNGAHVRFDDTYGTMNLSAPAVTGTGTVTSTASYAAATIGPAGVAWASWLGEGSVTFTITETTGAVFTVKFQQTSPYGTTNTPGTPTWTITQTDVTGTSHYVSAAGPTTYLKAACTFSVTINTTTIASMDVTYEPTNFVFIDSASCPIINAQGFEFGAPRQISVKFETKPIVAKDYKLKAQWSMEADQDVNALHGESLEDILANLLTQELMNETDYVVVRDLLNIAAYSGSWNKYPGVVSTTVTTSGTTQMPVFHGSLKDHYETLIYAMNDMANSIYSRILRGPANFAVVSPDVSTILESLSEFKTASINDMDTEIGISSTGALGSKYKVFKDARLPKGTLLMGFKGKDARDTGYVFAPYVPAVLSPIIWDPTTFAQNRMIMSRFGRATLLDGQFYYGKIAVTELNRATSEWASV